MSIKQPLDLIKVKLEIRDVTAEQKQLTQKLIVTRKELNIPLFETFIGYSGKIHTSEMPLFLNQFSTFQIDQILSGVHFLFSIDDIVSHVEIWKRDHAIQVYKALDEALTWTRYLIVFLQKGNDDEESVEDDWDDFMNDNTCFEGLSMILKKVWI